MFNTLPASVGEARPKESSVAYETDISTGRCPFRAVPFQQCYWNPELLSSFSFLMAGHGAPVRASMMLGDPGYAREQLRLACTFDDHLLQQVAVEMLNSFSPLAPHVETATRWAH